MEMTPELADLVLRDLSETKLAQEGKRQGMISMRQDGILKALRGVTTVEEVLKATEEETEETRKSKAKGEEKWQEDANDAKPTAERNKVKTDNFARIASKYGIGTGEES